ncbi:scavenger receptor cysteine-rich domain superfamily protein-like [Diadema setosum]|uniref:scavenger receptor cysteine-rich domain superfamily protein-like n=1 Tax=Diadema setosum TaxID=31175 RepID=UPI003B3A0352
MLFCPTCANVLVVEEGPNCLRFACNTCPYVHNVTRKISNRKYPRLKEVDDVLGGAAAWENVDSTADVRLNQGNGLEDKTEVSSGRVEVSEDGQNWAVLCAQNWNIDIANVVCRQLGFINAYNQASPAEFGQTTLYQDAALNDLYCMGSETNLNECSVGRFTANINCGNNIAAVICSGVRLVGANGEANGQQGRLDAYFNGKWGPVCKSPRGSSQNIADVVCNELDPWYSEASTVPLTDAEKVTSEQPTLFVLGCDNGEQMLSDCRIIPAADVGGCDSSYYMGIKCSLDDVGKHGGYKPQNWDGEAAAKKELISRAVELLRQLMQQKMTE